MENVTPTLDPQTDCPICLSILFHPITLTCGHNFCEQCIGLYSFHRKGNYCPICRKQIVPTLYKYRVNILLEECVKKLRPREYNEKLETAKEFKITPAIHSENKFIKELFMSIFIRFKSIINFLLRWSPILTLGLVFVILLAFKFKKRTQSEEIKMSRDELANLLAKLRGLLTQDHVNEKNEVDLQRLMLSKIIKYLFTNYAKLSFV